MITIRKATPNDAEAIATCLLLAMEAIVYRFIGKNDAEAAEAFMLHFAAGQNNQYAYENCWVATMNNEVVGAVNLYDGAQLKQLRAPVLAYIKQHYGKELHPEDETGPGELYIDTLGIVPAWQCKGIGTQLLQHLVYEYAEVQGHRLGMLVDEENPAAKRLYLKLGFKTVGGNTLMGKRMEHLQYKS